MIGTLALAFALAAAPSPCPPGSTVVMSCPAKKKHIAVCAGPTTGKPTFAQYRFGPLDMIIDKPELVVPKDTKAGFQPFMFGRRNLLHGTSSTLSFSNGDVRYEVWTQDGKDGGGGVNVKQGDKFLATIACTGDYEAHWEIIEPHVFADIDPASLDLGDLDLSNIDLDLDGPTKGGKAATTGGGKPDPLAGKDMKEICNDDVLLLLKYSWDDLRFNNAFTKNCCAKGALGKDDDRCQLDWPSSDMPECGFFDELRNGIFARYGYQFKEPKYQQLFGAKPWYRPRTDFDGGWLPKVAQANVTSLKAFACPKPAATATCDKAGIRWSVDLQKAAKGQMDGVQQSEIGEGLVAECKKGWSEDVAACFAAGKFKACSGQLTGNQLTDAWNIVRKISPETPLD